MSASAPPVARRGGRLLPPKGIGALGCSDRLDCGLRVRLRDTGDNLGRVCGVDVADLMTPGAPFARDVGPKRSTPRRDTHRHDHPCVLVPNTPLTRTLP